MVRRQQTVKKFSCRFKSFGVFFCWLVGCSLGGLGWWWGLVFVLMVFEFGLGFFLSCLFGFCSILHMCFPYELHQVQ